MLAWKNARICDEYPRLWPYGPVFPKVFNYIHKYGDIANFSTDISKVSTPENKEVIESVLNAFGKYDATSLSSWSHTEGSPWDRGEFSFQVQDPRRSCGVLQQSIPVPFSTRELSSAGCLSGTLPSSISHAG